MNMNLYLRSAGCRWSWTLGLPPFDDSRFIWHKCRLRLHTLCFYESAQHWRLSAVADASEWELQAACSLVWKCVGVEGGRQHSGWKEGWDQELTHLVCTEESPRAAPAHLWGGLRVTQQWCSKSVFILSSTDNKKINTVKVTRLMLRIRGQTWYCTPIPQVEIVFSVVWGQIFFTHCSLTFCESSRGSGSSLTVDHCLVMGNEEQQEPLNVCFTARSQELQRVWCRQCSGVRGSSHEGAWWDWKLNSYLTCKSH